MVLWLANFVPNARISPPHYIIAISGVFVEQIPRQLLVFLQIFTIRRLRIMNGRSQAAQFVARSVARFVADLLQISLSQVLIFQLLAMGAEGIEPPTNTV
jgi:hypothetical protein